MAQFISFWVLCFMTLVFNDIVASIHHAVHRNRDCVYFTIIRPHRSTTYVDAVYCHRPSSVVCMSVGRSRSVCHTSEPCKNGWTDRDAVWVEDSGRPKGPCIRWGFRSPHGKGQIFGGEWASHAGEYYWTVCLRRRRGLMSNYFDHLLFSTQHERN